MVSRLPFPCGRERGAASCEPDLEAGSRWFRWEDGCRADLRRNTPEPPLGRPKGQMRPGLADEMINPGARSWFTESAVDLIELTRTYLRLLDRHDVPWFELRTSRPGRVTYEDDVQLVAVPLRYPEDWPFDPNSPR